MVCTSVVLLLAQLEAIEVIDIRGPKILNSRCKNVIQSTKMSEHRSILKPWFFLEIADGPQGVRSQGVRSSFTLIQGAQVWIAWISCKLWRFLGVEELNTPCINVYISFRLWIRCFKHAPIPSDHCHCVRVYFQVWCLRVVSHSLALLLSFKRVMMWWMWKPIFTVWICRTNYKSFLSNPFYFCWKVAFIIILLIS